MLHPTYPIVTERLLLRPYAIEDAPAFAEMVGLPEVVRYLYWEVRGPEEAAEMLAGRAPLDALRAEGDWLVLAVERREDGALLGDVVLKWESRTHRTGEIGFVFHPAHHGQGYAHEASREILRLAFDGLGLHRVIGRCDARNTSSARLLGRLGLRQEAHLVENEWVKGEWTDELIFAMLEHEWREKAPLSQHWERGVGG